MRMYAQAHITTQSASPRLCLECHAMRSGSKPQGAHVFWVFVVQSRPLYTRMDAHLLTCSYVRVPCGWTQVLHKTVYTCLCCISGYSLCLTVVYAAYFPEARDLCSHPQQILKFLPLMIGWFALNVPAGLGVYWVVNNGLSTLQQW
jgi:hypothetical protein